MSTPELKRIDDPDLADLAFAQGVCWFRDAWMDPAERYWLPPSDAWDRCHYLVPADWIGHRLYKMWSTIEPPEGAVLARIADVEVDPAEWALVSTTAAYGGSAPIWWWPAIAAPPPEIPVEVAKHLLALGDVERAEVLAAAAGGEA